jgi:hypothetical protein
MARRTDPPAATVRQVRARDRHGCARCGNTEALTTHHRRNRGMGGSTWPGINRPANLLTLCGSGTTGCHGWVTDHPREARELGLSVSMHTDPAAVPVTGWAGTYLLTDEGDRETWTTP